MQVWQGFSFKDGLGRNGQVDLIFLPISSYFLMHSGRIWTVAFLWRKINPHEPSWLKSPNFFYFSQAGTQRKQNMKFINFVSQQGWTQKLLETEKCTIVCEVCLSVSLAGVGASGPLSTSWPSSPRQEAIISFTVPGTQFQSQGSCSSLFVVLFYGKMIRCFLWSPSVSAQDTSKWPEISGPKFLPSTQQACDTIPIDTSQWSGRRGACQL